MGSKVVQDSSLTLVADKIRSKTGSSGSINFPYGFVNQIDRLSLGGETPTGVRNIILNGTYDVTGDATAIVNVQPMLGTMDITENGTYNVADYSGATVNVPQGITPSGIKEITENGTYDITNFASAIVDVAGGIDFCDMSTSIPLDDTDELTFEHSMENAPTFVIIFAKDVNEVIGVFANRVVGYIQKSTQTITTNSSKGLRYSSLTPSIVSTDTDITVTMSTSYMFAGSVEYVCLAW